MLWTILAVLVALWLLGVVTRHTLGGLVHALPVVALVLLGVRLASGAVQTSLESGVGIAEGTQEDGARPGLVFDSGVPQKSLALRDRLEPAPIDLGDAERAAQGSQGAKVVINRMLAARIRN